MHHILRLFSSLLVVLGRVRGVNDETALMPCSSDMGNSASWLVDDFTSVINFATQSFNPDPLFSTFNCIGDVPSFSPAVDFTMQTFNCDPLYLVFHSVGDEPLAPTVHVIASLHPGYIVHYLVEQAFTSLMSFLPPIVDFLKFPETVMERIAYIRGNTTVISMIELAGADMGSALQSQPLELVVEIIKGIQRVGSKTVMVFLFFLLAPLVSYYSIGKMVELVWMIDVGFQRWLVTFESLQFNTDVLKFAAPRHDPEDIEELIKLLSSTILPILAGIAIKIKRCGVRIYACRRAILLNGIWSSLKLYGKIVGTSIALAIGRTSDALPIQVALDATLLLVKTGYAKSAHMYSHRASGFEDLKADLFSYEKTTEFVRIGDSLYVDSLYRDDTAVEPTEDSYSTTVLNHVGENDKAWIMKSDIGPAPTMACNVLDGLNDVPGIELLNMEAVGPADKNEELAGNDPPVHTLEDNSKIVCEVPAVKVDDEQDANPKTCTGDSEISTRSDKLHMFDSASSDGTRGGDAVSDLDLDSDSGKQQGSLASTGTLVDVSQTGSLESSGPPLGDELHSNDLSSSVPSVPESTEMPYTGIPKLSKPVQMFGSARSSQVTGDCNWVSMDFDFSGFTAVSYKKGRKHGKLASKISLAELDRLRPVSSSARCTLTSTSSDSGPRRSGTVSLLTSTLTPAPSLPLVLPKQGRSWQPVPTLVAASESAEDAPEWQDWIASLAAFAPLSRKDALPPSTLSSGDDSPGPLPSEDNAKPKSMAPLGLVEDSQLLARPSSEESSALLAQPWGDSVEERSAEPSPPRNQECSTVPRLASGPQPPPPPLTPTVIAASACLSDISRADVHPPIEISEGSVLERACCSSMKDFEAWKAANVRTVEDNSASEPVEETAALHTDTPG